MEPVSLVRAPGNRRSGWRSLAAEVLISLFVVGGVELGFRAYVDRSPTFPLPRLFGSSIASAKYLGFRRASAQRERTDVIVMGLSPMMVTNSRHLGDYLRSRGREATVFNFALPLHSVDYDRFLLRDIVLAMQEAPRVLVYGVMPFNILYEGPSRETEELTRQFPGFQFHEPTLAARVRAIALTSVQLLLYREVIRDNLLTDAAKPDPRMPRARAIDDFGDTARLPPRPAPQSLSRWEKVKYQPQLRTFLSVLRGGLLVEHIGALGAFCREHGIRLLVVNSAVSPFFLELLPNGRSDYDEFVWRMASAATVNGASFLDLAGPSLGPADAFVDSHHLNEAAALAMTERLGAFLLDEGLLAGD